jgi:glycosyltransferase involved in cell wall biosynthesis
VNPAGRPRPRGERNLEERADEEIIRGRDFLVLSDDWYGLPTSTIHLFRWLVKGNRVFWWRIVNRRPRWSMADAGKVLDVVRTGLTPPGNHPGRPGGNSPIHSTPFFWPTFGAQGRRFNRFSLMRAYRKLCKIYRIDEPILVTTFPSTVDFVRSVNAKLKVYYCVDNWSEYPGLDHYRLGPMEDDLVQTVDAVVATSQTLTRRWHHECPSMYLPQGVDFDHFAQPALSGRSVPTIAQLPRPIVGFFGLISGWVDLDLIRHMSHAYPNVSFVLIGKTEIPRKSLVFGSNVHWMGPVPYAELPAWSQYFDVGWIPFRLNDLTKSVNPLKLLEYYALGLPVLSTRLPDLEDVEGPVFLASTYTEFCKQLARILREDRARLRRDAMSIARKNSWQHRVQQLGGFIERQLREKGKTA